MNLFRRLVGILSRVISGNDIVLVPQDVSTWNKQYADGAWNRLLKKKQKNSETIKEIIDTYSVSHSGSVSILDVGCGNGNLARLLAHRFKYVGVDISEEAIKKAREVARSAEFIISDASKPPENIGTFDILIFNEFLYYVDLVDTLRAYRTKARSGALVVISIYNSWRSFFLWRRVQKAGVVGTRQMISDSSGRKWAILAGFYSNQ